MKRLWVCCNQSVVYPPCSGHSAQSRTREVIEASGAYERDQFVPGPPSK